SAYGRQDFPGALSYYQQVEALLPQVKSMMIKADNAHGLAGCYLRLGDEKKALEYRNKALEIAKEKKFHSVIFAVYGDLADVYEEKGNFKEAIHYRLLGIDYAKQTGWIEMEARAHKTTGYTFKQAGDFKQALYHFEQLKEIEDSLARFEVQNRYHELELKYESGQKDLQIEQLKGKNLRMWLYVLAALVLGGLLFLNYYRRTNKKLLLQNLELSGKNLEIKRALTEGQNIERKRMAIELHDNINAKIAAAKWILETINTPDKSQEEQLVINRLVDAMSDIYEDVRFISHNLVPKDIEANTLNELIGQFLQNLSQNQKIKFTFIPAQREPEIGNALKIQAYAMIMELINNIIRHSECQKASVQLNFDDEVMDIRVEDDGKGFVADINQSGTGLKNLTSRVKSVNGSLKISNGLKHGVTVHISIPLRSNGTEQSSE
ncbi:MAG: tetratricopeptide repeat protein, partial [Saprospiraceae bacterium]|nr:tetratricopeptide repeat protein [Saprospiraceae bacterium]